MAAQVALRRQQAQEENEARELGLLYGPNGLLQMNPDTADFFPDAKSHTHRQDRLHADISASEAAEAKPGRFGSDVLNNGLTQKQTHIQMQHKQQCNSRSPPLLSHTNQSLEDNNDSTGM